MRAHFGLPARDARALAAYRAGGWSAGSVSGVEFDGQGGGPGDSDDGLPGGGAGAAGVGHATRDDGQGLGEFESGEVCSEAVVTAAAERKHGRRPLAGDVEAVGVVVDGGVAVG